MDHLQRVCYFILQARIREKKKKNNKSNNNNNNNNGQCFFCFFLRAQCVLDKLILYNITIYLCILINNESQHTSFIVTVSVCRWIRPYCLLLCLHNVTISFFGDLLTTERVEWSVNSRGQSNKRAHRKNTEFTKCYTVECIILHTFNIFWWISTSLVHVLSSGRGVRVASCW